MAAQAGKITVSHVKYPGIADCEDCIQLDPDSTREECRRHAKETGHTVHFLIEEVTKYTLGQSGGTQRAHGI